MNDILKQRLVGALVIIALGVIFWPVIFNDPVGERLDQTSQVPRIPSLKKMRLEAPTPLENIAPVRPVPLEEPVAQTSLPEPAQAAAQAPRQEQELAQEGREMEQSATRDKPKTKLDAEGIPIAWVLQVVTVSKKSKAEALVKELIELGHKAYYKPLQQGDTTLYKVNLGPKFERKSIQEIKQVVDKKFNVNSIVARYLP